MNMENNKKALVVEDDTNIAELLRLYLEKDGFDVLIAGDGQKGIDLALSEKPDIMLLDIMLPGKSGWQVCREVRKTSKMPIIMLTAKGETFDKVSGLGRRRLHHQALRGQGAARAHTRRPPPHRAGGGRGEAPPHL